MPIPCRLIAVLAVLGLLGACATKPKSGIGNFALVSQSADAIGGGVDGRLSDERIKAPQDGRMDVLVLSGGGSDGAFGAGLLNGWTERGDRPEFEVVTGVSTGALIATLAFLGPEYDSVLRRVFTTSTDKDIMKSRGVVGLLKGSYYSRAPLEAQIAAAVDSAVLERVAAEHRKGRRLYVISHNLDAGLPVIWDMGKVAVSNDPNKLEFYRALLAASAAIPGAFPPVYLPNKEGSVDAHVDGGVRNPFAFRGWMVNTGARESHVWVITNGGLRPANETGPVGPNLNSILARTVSDMLKSVTYKNLYQIYAVANNTGAHFHLAYVRPEEPETDPIEFDPVAMTRLFEYGRAQAKSGAIWTDTPPFMTKEEIFPRRAVEKPGERPLG